MMHVDDERHDGFWLYLSVIFYSDPVYSILFIYIKNTYFKTKQVINNHRQGKAKYLIKYFAQFFKN